MRNGNARTIAARLYRRLAGMGVPKDIVVVETRDVDRLRDVPGMVVRAACQDGRALYAPSPEVRQALQGWMTKAEHDLRIAEHPLTLREERPFHMVCFHAQHCAEEYLKALLVYYAIDPAQSRDLTELLPLCLLV